MHYPTRLIAMLAAPLALAACSSGDKANQTAETPTAQNTPMSSSMPMASGAPMQGKAAGGEGTVTAVDQAAGTISIQHGAIPAVNWPAMTMAFQANDAQRSKVAVGDKVMFDFHTTATGGELTRIDRKE